MGLLDALAGGIGQMAEGASQVAGEQIKSEIEKNREEALTQMRADLQLRNQMQVDEAHEKTRRAGKEFDTNYDNSPEVTAMRAAAQSGIITGTTAAKAAEHKTLADVDTEVEKTRAQNKLELERKEEIARGSDPAYLAAGRKLALMNHIVDPSYVAMPNADGTTDMVNSRNPKQVVKVSGPDGKPLIRKDPEELKAASSLLNDANKTLTIAEAKYKVDSADLDAATKAKAEVEWKDAQKSATEQKAAALAMLMRKTKPEDHETPPTDAVTPESVFPARPQAPTGIIGTARPEPVTQADRDRSASAQAARRAAEAKKEQDIADANAARDAQIDLYNKTLAGGRR